MATAKQITSDFKGDHLSVSMFGVVGDGTADDTAALQAAVTAAANRTLLIPPAKSYYKVNGTINVPSNITIRCEKATRIVQTKPKTPLISVSGQADVIIYGCSLESLGAADWDPAHNTNAHLIEVVNSSSVRIERCYLSKYGHAAIMFMNAKKLWIHECVIVGLDGSTIHTTDNYNFGIVALGSGVGYGPITITDCDISYGVTCINSQDDTNDWLISGCSLHDTMGQHGIYVNPGQRGPVIVGNRFYNLALDGTKHTKTTGDTENCHSLTIVGNSFYNCGNACVNLGIASGSLYLHNVTVVGNTCEYADYGISCVGPDASTICQNFLIADNNISHCGNYGMRIANVTGRLHGNYIHDIGGMGLYVYPGISTLTVHLADNCVIGAGNGQAYAGAGIIASQLGIFLGYGNFVLHNNIVLVDPAAAYSSIYDHASLTFAGSNFIDQSRSNNYVSSTVTSSIMQTFDGRFLMGDPTGGGPQATAALEIRSTTRGFLPPNMTTAQRDAIASPVAGLHIFNGSVARPQFYAGGWKQFEIWPGPPDLAPYTAGDTTPSIAGYGRLVTMMIANSAATSITNFTGASANGQVLVITFADANTTLLRGGTMIPKGGGNYVSSAFAAVLLMYYGGVWRQV